MSDHHNKHEAKWAINEEVQFKITVRRNKLLGLWAAAELGLSGEDAEAYAKTVVSSDFKEPGDEDVIRKVMGDFSAKGVKTGDDVVRQKLREFGAQVYEQLKAAG